MFANLQDAGSSQPHEDQAASPPQSADWTQPGVLEALEPSAISEAIQLQMKQIAARLG